MHVIRMAVCYKVSVEWLALFPVKIQWSVSV